MVLGKRRQVVVPSAVDADQRDPGWVHRLQLFALPDRYQPVFGTVENISMTLYRTDPAVGPEMITQHPVHRQDGQEPFHHFFKTVVRRIKDQVARVIRSGQLRGYPAADASPVNKYMLLAESFPEPVVHELRIMDQVLLAPLARTLSKAAVIDQDHIIFIPVKITRILRPTLDAPAIAMKIKYKALGRGSEKMKAVDPHTGCGIEEKFFKGIIIGKPEIGSQFFGFKDEFFLQEIGGNGQNDDADKDVQEDHR